MKIVVDYIRGDSKRADLIFNEVKSILYIAGLAGTLISSTGHMTPLGADLKFIGTLRAPLNILPLLRLINPWGESEDQSNKSRAEKALKMGGNIRCVLKVTGWALKELDVDTPLIGACNELSKALSYGTTFGKLALTKPSSNLTRPRQYLTLALIPLGWTAFAKANPSLITYGSLIAGLIAFRETQLAFRKLEQEKTS